MLDSILNQYLQGEWRNALAHYFLLGGPGENGDTLSETLINVDKLDKTVLFFFCGIRIYPHTALYDLAVETGQITDSQDLLDPVF